jgi:hypothetical protein
MILRLPSVLLLAILAAFFAGAGSTQAAELVMFDDPGCSWCRRWHAEIGPGYPHSPEGKLAPLRRVHIRDQGSAGVRLASPVRGTPTFVLAENGQEIGRIVGYPGSDFFYPRLAELLERLPRPSPEPRVPAARSARAGETPALRAGALRPGMPYERQASRSGR